MRGVEATRRVGVRDVARLAGVSTQTVSRVLNDYPGIRDETRQRVLDAVDVLGYRINNAARALGTATTRTIGVIASDASLYGPSNGIVALEAAAREAGRWIATAYADASDETSVTSAAQHLLAQGVDGIVVVAPHARTLDVLGNLGVPISALPTEGPQQAAAAALVVDHLVAAGHRRIGMLAGPSDWLEAAARAEGVESALVRHRLRVAGRWEGDWSADSGHRVAGAVAGAVRADAGPTAVVVANDQMALGLIAGLRETGLEVPRDVSVAGFDDNPDAAFYRPALTTVRLDLAGEARRSIAEVCGLAGPAPLAPGVLVARASTAPAGR